MGNQFSCRSVGVSEQIQAVSCKVLLPGGELRLLREPVKAAEIMLEHPAHFLVNAGSLVAGRRFSALAADDDLAFGNAYVVFPMKWLGSVITAEDVSVLVRTAAAKRACSGSAGKVSPADGSPVNDVDRLGAAAEYRQHRLSSCRSKKPLLETIVEEPDRIRGRR
ncbi:unnamed protein product [Cuscuta campestris]|uniref:DUF4228 domain-containing protein n=1 Tax=Cuscuta campestris TaxID=132261 RepID=A0A484LNN7_9ASTE|nr:unnamed protein product [Cuscuta campestris]